MLSAQLATALFQGLQFVLIARGLGAHDFGRMAGVLAITSLLLPFSGIGAGNVMVMRLARQEAPASLYYGNGLMVASISGMALVLLAATIGPVFLRDSNLFLLILILGISEIIFTKFVDISAHVFYGLDKHALSGAFYSIHASIRLIAAGTFALFFSHEGVLFWAGMHLCAGVLATLIVFTMTVKRIGRPHFDPRLAAREIKVGVLFSIGLSANSAYTDIDKAVIARYASSQIVGQYTAAYRLVYMAFTPVMAVLLSTQAMFFRAGGENGISGTLKLATRVAWLGTIYCIGLAALLYICSPLAAWALGPQYHASIEILRTLGFLPLVLMLQSVFSEALTGANRQRARSIAQVATALLCFTLNMSLVPRFGWQGAVVATYLSQIVLAGLIVWTIRRSMRSSA